MHLAQVRPVDLVALEDLQLAACLHLGRRVAEPEALAAVVAAVMVAAVVVAAAAVVQRMWEQQGRMVRRMRLVELEAKVMTLSAVLEEEVDRHRVVLVPLDQRAARSVAALDLAVVAVAVVVEIL